MGVLEEGEGDRNRQVELFYRYLSGRGGGATVTGRIIETHGQQEGAAWRGWGWRRSVVAKRLKHS